MKQAHVIDALKEAAKDAAHACRKHRTQLREHCEAMEKSAMAAQDAEAKYIELGSAVLSLDPETSDRTEGGDLWQLTPILITA